MEINKEVQPRGVFKFTVAIPWPDVAKVREHIVTEAANNASVKGFRRGKAPTPLVEQTLDDGKVYGEVINHLVPEILTAITKDNPLEIISQPKIQVQKFESNEPVEITVTIITSPKVEIGDWRKHISENKPAKKDDALGVIVSKSTVELPEELVQDERDRMLGRLLQQLQSLGLQVNSYLSSQNKSIDDLKKDYFEQAEKSLKMHFVLQELVNLEKIDVTEEEITAAVQAAPDPDSKKVLESPEQKWYIKSVLARNKALEVIYAYLDSNSN